MKIDAEKLRRLRTQQVLSIRELAHRSGVGHEAIILIERGARQPFPSTIRKLAAGLGIPPGELLLQEENDSTTASEAEQGTATT
jgi:transcriptional regulator with XRE-family HTH domain